LTWLDRLSEAAYTSPGGTRQTFLYEDVSREFTKRTAAFEFPGVDGAYIQDNGHSERRFPLQCIFAGPDCDRQALAFERLLLERGVGRLEHPMYGRVQVVPFGTITRRDDLRRGANQAIIEVTFFSTVGAIYPSSGSSPRHEVLESLNVTDAAVSEQFERSMRVGTEARRANAKLATQSRLQAISAGLGAAAASTAEVRRQFAEQQRAINSGVDVLVGQPLLLAQQILNLVKAPGRASAGIQSRLSGYADLLDRMIASSVESPGDQSVLPALRVRLANDFILSDLVAAASLTGSVTSVLSNEFAAKPQAIEAADEIARQAEAHTDWREERYGDIEEIDTGEGYQALQESVALTIGYLVEISFSLVPERSVVLDRPRNIIELCAELYGSIDDRLDFLISTNRLSGSEILELPRGRRVVYYA
jgi:prophage DNA circulation protein